MNLEARYNIKVKQDSAILPWLIIYSAMLINMCHVGSDGRTPYERGRRRKFKKAIPEFGECVWFMRRESVGENKLDTRWEEGIYVGIKEESGELLIANKEGVRKIRSWAKKSEGERWKEDHHKERSKTTSRCSCCDSRKSCRCHHQPT